MMRWTHPFTLQWKAIGLSPWRPVDAQGAPGKGMPRAVQAGFLLGLALFSGASGACGKETIRGLPFTRSYPLEEIGNVPRGPRLGFDAFGRLAVTHNGVYEVLNDTTWVDMSGQPADDGVIIVRVLQASEGRAYYGSRGSWGRVEFSAEGRLRAIPLAPADRPEWTLTASFSELLANDDGIFFAGWEGVVWWDPAKEQCRYFEVGGLSAIFRVGQRVFVSPYQRPLHELDYRQGILRPVANTDFAGSAVEFATPLDDTRTLLGIRDGRLVVFDGASATEWPWQAKHGLTGDISAVHHLIDGGTAVAIADRGLFLVSPEGELTSALTAPPYHRITGLGSREPGVLWVVTEDSIEKVLYGSPLTVFGQRLGLPVQWPKVVRWNGRVVVATRGRLYAAVAGPPGAASRFEPMPTPPTGAWAAAAFDSRMLVGNSAGVFVAESDGTFTPVPSVQDVQQLIMVGADLCFAIGKTETAALRWAGGQWSECAPRIGGVGHPAAVTHATAHAAWLELGANRVARLSLQEGRIKLRTFDKLAGNAMQWVNVGIVDDLVVLSGAIGKRLYFDERTESFCAAPQLERLLARSPHWIIRMEKDESGTLWAAHEEGVVTFTPKDGDYEMDVNSFDGLNDRYPVVHVLPHNDVWLSAGRSLHHVEQRRASERPGALQPQLVSVEDSRTNVELLHGHRARAEPLRLRFDQNSVALRFFSGTYAWRRAPIYEFRLNGADRWATLGSGSLLSLSGLHEGTYHLQVRIAGRGDRPAEPTTFDFEILPPWPRTSGAYVAYGLGLVFAIVGLVEWSSRRARRRNLALEQLVRDRTRQLEKTMEQLNEETRNAATLAERNRLAGEIHDSLQQGLSGAILQLDATLKLRSVTGLVRSRLEVVRNMVSYTRHEVQHAVWDLESPLLADTELGEALRKLTGLINPGTAKISIDVSGTPVPLPSATKHHLLRIAQETTTNAVRHASAQRIAIQVDYQADVVALTVVDDGVGFEPDDVLSKSGGHFGLRGLRDRARKLEGEIEIHSLPGQGTTIRVSVPLHPQPLIATDAQNRSF
ncbi:sensor histidine kinase [Opitutus terrae]|uniref:Histidine kinase n=1 Tax=Opitutus terrae (strain DSM 11246 / JCM 15787 / PB90-1) TaxID=452637 RepID=B1ZU88_OPITP|nr:sensor histidine kinase [Opitutus terrae]ACB76650.1 histidine kinase [Opitutus terrae PB90-1]